MLARAVCLKIKSAAGGIVVNDPDIMRTNQSHGLRISFDVSMSGGATNATINVYNLSRAVNSGLSARVGENTAVELWVGYGVANKLLYKGILMNVSIQKQSTDIITTFYSIDYIDDPRKMAITRNFALQTPRQDVANTLIGDLIAKNPLLQQGYQSPFIGTLSRETKFEGHVVDELQKVCREENKTLAIADNTVSVYDNKYGSPEPPFIITSETGLISTPVVSLSQVDFSTILDVRLKPFQKVMVASFRFNIGEDQFTSPMNGAGSISNLLLLTVAHAGDTHSGSWQSSVRGSVIELF